MKRRAGKILGLALSQKSALVAEVSGKAGGWSVGQMAEFVYPEGQTLETPAELGQSLKQFLRAQKFSTRDAVMGLPAKRLLTRRKEVPPAAPAMAASMLRLQAEGEFSSEADSLVMDFAGETSSTTTSAVLLIAASRQDIGQCNTLAKVAGLKLFGVTVTAAALGRATSRVPGGDGVVVNLAQGGAELVVQHGESSTQVRHLNVNDPAAAESISALVGEIRRTVAALPRNGSPLTLAVWNGGAGAENTGSLLEQRLSMPVTTPELRSIVSTNEPTANRFAPAVAVALAAMETQGLPIDFLHSRLAPPPPVSNKRRIAWGVAIAAAVVILVGVLLSSYNDNQNKLKRDQADLDSKKDRLADAMLLKNHLDFARKWAPGKPSAVLCMRDLTKLFPDEGSIWVTGFYLHPNMTGDLLGKASSSQQVLKLLDKLNESPLFKGAKWTDAHDEANRNGSTVSFTISFAYHPATATPTTTEAKSGTK